MALQVWLPLNKSGADKNQGLGDSTITNFGAVYESSGKLGGCYKCTNSAGIHIESKPWMKMVPGNSFSVSMWIKGCSGNTWAIACTSWELNFRTSVLSVYPGGTLSNGGCAIYQTFDNDTWYHIAFSYNGDIPKLSLYLNGEFKQEYVTTYIREGIASTITLPYGDTRYINDFRLYDECLSADQIKEISRGMVLHYKMYGNVQIPNNCYSNPTFDTSNSDGGWNHWTASGGSGSFAQNTDKNFIFRSGQTYSHKVVCDSSATYDYLCYQEPAFSGGYRSMCAIIKASDGVKITENICYPTWNSRNGGVENNKWTSINKLRDGFYLCKCEGIKQGGSNDLVGIYVKPGKTIYISECYLENDYERCSDFWTRTDIEYDGSGYKNHGTVSGNVTLSADSPRYTGSYKFGTNNYITTTSTGNYIKSATFWAKDAGSVPSDGLVFRDQNSGLAFGIQSGKLITGAIGGPAGSSSVPVSVSDAKYTANTWHFFACVNDNGTQRLYMDGIQISIGTGTGIWSQGSPTNSLNVGGRAGSSYWPGYISDFKMYVTVLSATDVQELYKLGRV